MGPTLDMFIFPRRGDHARIFNTNFYKYLSIHIISPGGRFIFFHLSGGRFFFTSLVGDLFSFTILDGWFAFMGFGFLISVCVPIIFCIYCHGFSIGVSSGRWFLFGMHSYHRASNSPALRGSLPPIFSCSPAKHLKSPSSMKKIPPILKSPAAVLETLRKNYLANFHRQGRPQKKSYMIFYTYIPI